MMIVRSLVLCLLSFVVARANFSTSTLPQNERTLQRAKVTTVYYSTDNPSMSPTRYDRPANLIVCSGVQAEVVTLETDVEFYTRIETDSPDTTLSDATTIIMLVSGEAIDSLATRICKPTSTNSSIARRLEESCIISISMGTPDKRIVSCEPEMEASKSCTWYRGSIRLLHVDKCTSNDITSRVIETLRNITTADFSETTNWGAVKVTDVEFTDAPSLDKEVTGKSIETGRKRLTSSGTAITIISAFMLVGLVMLLLGIRRVRRHRLSKVSFDDTAIGNVDEKSKSHIEPNWRDIGGRHSGMDCRHCNSLMCSECGSENNQVRMLKFDRNTIDNISKVKDITKEEKNSETSNRLSRPKRTSHRKVESDENVANGDDNNDVTFINSSVNNDVQNNTGYRSVIL